MWLYSKYPVGAVHMWKCYSDKLRVLAVVTVIFLIKEDEIYRGTYLLPWQIWDEFYLTLCNCFKTKIASTSIDDIWIVSVSPLLINIFVVYYGIAHGYTFDQQQLYLTKNLFFFNLVHVFFIFIRRRPWLRLTLYQIWHFRTDDFGIMTH